MCKYWREIETDGGWTEYCKLHFGNATCCGEKDRCDWPEDYEATDSEVTK